MRVKQNNEWINMSEEIQWRMNNEWNRHSSANYPNYYVLDPSVWGMAMAGRIEFWDYGTYLYPVIPEVDVTGKFPVSEAVIPEEAPLLGIATGSTNLETTAYMFYGHHAHSEENNTIELDYFFTPEVTTMEGMFEASGYEYLDLRSFDTTKCSNFGYMFAETEFLTTLDISSFNININNDDIEDMFSFSSVGTVYVKSRQIADYLDMYGGKSGINFVVGSST